MSKSNPTASGPMIVGGVQSGHQHLDDKNHASKGYPSFEGKSMRPGGGGRFAKGKSELMKKGMNSKSAGAIMAAAGRRKYGAAQMSKFSAAGRKRGK